ncbi:transposase, partial [Fusarium austroafricanum]
MPSYTEEDMLIAINLVQNGLSQVKAAEEATVPRSSLRDRLKGIEPRKKAHADQQRLGPTVEADIISFLRLQDTLCTPLTHFQIRQLVIRILRSQGDHKPLGKHWVTRFITRSERIKSLKAIRVEFKRIEGSKSIIIRSWFDQLKDPEVTVIRGCNRWNMDETGIFQGVGINGLVIGQSEKRKTLKRSPHRRSWVTITEAICADGTSLIPFVIFKGDQPQQQWFPRDPSFLGNWRFTTSPKGWTTNEIAALWLKEIFIPYLKMTYRRELEMEAPLVEQGNTAKAAFLRCYFKARAAAFTEEKIRAGWLASGLWPINVMRPLSSKYVIPDEIEAEAAESGNPSTPPANTRAQFRYLNTPHSQSDVIQLAKAELGKDALTPTKRHLFRTIGKGLDDRAVELALTRDENRILSEKNDQSEVSKRKKLSKDPNQK